MQENYSYRQYYRQKVGKIMSLKIITRYKIVNIITSLYFDHQIFT